VPSPLDHDGQAAAIPRSAAFSTDGRTLLTEASAPDCPMTVVPHPTSMLPTAVPSCTDVATRLTRWSLDGSRAPNTVAYRRRGPSASAPVPLAFSGPAQPAATLALLDDRTVVRQVTAWARTPPGAPTPWTLWAIDERIDLSQPPPDVAAACRRLPAPMRQWDEAAWRRQLPGEAPRAICPPPTGAADADRAASIGQ
jgi:hypothetical protein